jgi:AraC family transcriptional regulator
MQPRIEILKGKKFVGQRLEMSLVENKTVELWKGFIPRRKEIQNQISNDLYSIQVYDLQYFDQFKPSSIFEKWAAVEVSDFLIIPAAMEKVVIENGQYAVFDYKGSSLDSRIFEYIFGIWLPDSNYELDNRPHFQILGEKYKNADPESEEEIWIPIR